MALIGDLTTVAQLIAKISDAVSTARDLPRVCWRFAVHLQDIGRHLEPLRGAQLDKATQQTLANLQRTLESSYDVIVDCSRRSYAYRLIKGKSIRDKIREAQDEVDRILRLFPLIQLSQDYGYRPSYGSSDDEEEDPEQLRPYDSEDEYSDEEHRSGDIIEEYVPKFRELSLNANANVNRRLNEEWVEDDREHERWNDGDHQESVDDDDHEQSDDDDDDGEESDDDDDDSEESDDDDDDDDREESDDDDDDREESDEDEYHPHYS
ncbi:cell number regulator 13 [Musa acuminata AAA Group]|uniref:cell number regulator 13 n=1 Tax=Musa acuminata AAA Group TaxID=214697 RepID=UPI0031E09B67